MKLHIERAGNGQTIIASENGPVAYMAPDLPEAVEESLAAAFAAAPAFLTDLTRIAKLETALTAAANDLACIHDSSSLAVIDMGIQTIAGRACDAARAALV